MKSMKRRFSEEQMIGILTQQESGVKTIDVFREHNIIVRHQRVQMRYIAPGCPWQNAYSEASTDESFHSHFRAECLGRQWFHTVREAAVVVEAWRRHYNQERLHSSLSYVPPYESEHKRHLAKQHQTSHNTAILPT